MTISQLSLRQQYLLEIDLIKKEYGSLEQMRLSLGLSQRRLCQVLLVDPSAFTRWNKSGAPPHIYKALKWLLLLKKIDPQVIEPTSLSKRVDLIQSTTSEKINTLESKLSSLNNVLSSGALNSSGAEISALLLALKTQEKHFEGEIVALKAVIKTLSKRKPKAATKKRKKRKSQKKASKKKTKKQNKKKTKRKTTKRKSAKKIKKKTAKKIKKKTAKKKKRNPLKRR